MDEQKTARVRRTEGASTQNPHGGGAFFTDLPDGCVNSIVKYLSPKDVARGACVCRGFRDALDSDVVWERFVCKSTLKVVGHKKELRAASKKKIFRYLLKPFPLCETVAYWLDQRRGEGCYSVAPRDLRIAGGEDWRYWEWSFQRGSRWPESACLLGVTWFESSGSLKCELPPGTYTLSWRIQYRFGRVNGWDFLPTEFNVSTTDGSQSVTSHRYFTYDAKLQRELCDLTPVRLVDHQWLEFDAGEINVTDGEKTTSLEFSMTEIECNCSKNGIILDGVVLRPSSVTRVTGRYL